MRVREAPRGKKPSWGGFVPQMLGFDLCQKMRSILAEDREYAYLDEESRTVLAARREDLGPLLRCAGRAIQSDADALRWWTFAGGRVNHTLKYALEWLGGWKVVADNFLVRIEGDGATQGALDTQLARMAAPGFWEAEETRRAILAKVPEYRLSKFQSALTDAAAVEMIGGYLLDWRGTERVVGA